MNDIMNVINYNKIPTTICNFCNKEVYDYVTIYYLIKCFDCVEKSNNETNI